MTNALRRWRWRLRGFFLLSPAAGYLAAFCFLVFVVQQTTARVEFAYGYSYSNALVSCFGLNWVLFSHGFFWQPVTYLFLHASLWHLALNVLTILLFGSGLEREIGSRQFLRIFFGGGILAGLGWMAVLAVLPFFSESSWTSSLPALLRNRFSALSGNESLAHAMCIGASGGVFALIGAYSALFPKRQVYLLLVVFPVRMKARTLALVLGLSTIVEAVLIQSQIAYAAHLSGGLAGFIYGMVLKKAGGERDEDE